VRLLDRGDRVIVGPMVGEHDQSRELSVSIFDPIFSCCMIGTSSCNTAGGNHDLAAVRDTANFRCATDAQEALPKTGRCVTIHESDTIILYFLNLYFLK